MSVDVREEVAEQAEPSAAPPSHDVTVGWGELAMLFVVAGVGLTAWVSLVLAQLGRHDLPLATLLTGVLLLAAMVVAGRHPSLPRIVVDGYEAAIVGVVGVVSAVMYWPGHPYALGDKDPGVYVAHGMAISREGSLSIPDAIGAAGLEGRVHYSRPGNRFPGYWLNPDDLTEVLPQFYHQWPALLGTAADLGGFGAVVNLTPVLGMISTVTIALAVRRGIGRNLFGTVAAVFAGVLLATNMLQVWQAKNPSTEILTQMYLSGATLAVVIAIRTRWVAAAGLAGVLVALSFQARPDGLALVLLAIGVGAVMFGFGRWNRCAAWFAAGLAVPLIWAVYQAYWLNETYTLANNIPSLRTVAGLVVFMVVVAVVTRILLAGPLAETAERVVAAVPRRRAELIAGTAIVVAFGAMLVFFWFRPAWLGEDMFVDNSGTSKRSWNEENLLRLSWFFSPVGIIAMYAGLCVLALRRWSASAWALVLPGLVVLPVYLWDASISPRLIWWGRRFVPMVIIAIVVLMAIALAWAISRWGRGGWYRPLAVAGLAVSVFLVGFQVDQSWRLRSHDEFGQSINVLDRLADVAGEEQALFIWIGEHRGLARPSRNLAGPLWFIENQYSTILGEDLRIEVLPEFFVEQYADEFPDRQIYLVHEGNDLPPGFDATRVSEVSRFLVFLPFWEETFTRTPDKPHPDGMPIDLRVLEWNR